MELMSNTISIENALGPYTIGDFPIYPMIPWVNPFDGVKPWVAPPYPDYTPQITTYITGGTNVSNKEESKLQYIKGLIEGAHLSESTDKIDLLLDKIIEVIES